MAERVARSVTALAWQAPRPLCAAADLDGQASASAVNKASQALSLAGPWQWLRGYLAQGPSKHNGLLHVSVASRSQCSLGVHTAARPAGACNPRYVLRPFAPARGISAAHAAPKAQACAGHGFAIAASLEARRLRAVLKVGPARPPAAPRTRRVPFGTLGLPSLMPPPRKLTSTGPTA